MKERVSREKDYNVNERSPVKQLAKIGELALNMHKCGSPLKAQKARAKSPENAEEVPFHGQQR